LNKKERPRMGFFCQQCGNESPKWMGRCPACGEWNSYVEAPRQPAQPKSHASGPANEPVELVSVSSGDAPRMPTALGEMDRVLGGGLVPGSLVLLGGDPGIGKSTLLLAVADSLARQGRPVLYLSGEESLHQVKLRAERLQVRGEKLFLLAETDLEAVLSHLDALSPSMAIIDSIQTISLDEVSGGPGSIAQVRECALRLMRWAKAKNIPVLIAGHVTKEGNLAGPKLLEHMVDVVLYLEGEPFGSYRILRGVKNRFGSTNEVGVFEMREAGLMEVRDPSMAFLAERNPTSSGSAVVTTMQGTRPLLVEVQALTNPTPYPNPRRTANGVDFNRLLLVVAVLSRRAGLRLADQDIIVNVVGGLKVEEPAADLGIALAIASSLRDIPVKEGTVAFGEVGLSGEVRSVSHGERRLAEAASLGFNRAISPPNLRTSTERFPNLSAISVGTLHEAIKEGLSDRRKASG